MVQQRKAQPKQTLGPKQSLPARASKRQCTVPHPLSGELQMAWEGWSDWGRWGGVLGDSPEGVPTMALTYVALTHGHSKDPKLRVRKPALGAGPF